MNLVPIRIGTLRPGDVINFDIYIQVGDRHLHYIRKADPFDGDRIEKLRSKGVKKLFIPEDSEAAYLEYLDLGLNRLQDSAMPTEHRESLVRDAMVTDAENAVRNVQTQAGYERTQQRMHKIVEFLMSDTGVVKNLLESAGVSQDNFQHCANVATLSIGVAIRCGMTQSSQQVELGLAGLLHDIGYSKLDFDPRKPLDQFSADQLAKYQEHPKLGAEMLADKPYVTKAVLDLIADHEEIGNALGFPNKKRLQGLSVSQQIFNLCNDYDRYSLLRKESHRAVAKAFFQDKIGCFELEHIKHLMAVFKN